MMYPTYLRVEKIAGGCFASDRSFIRALRSRLNKNALKRESRAIRREIIGELFDFRDKSIALYFNTTGV